MSTFDDGAPSDTPGRRVTRVAIGSVVMAVAGLWLVVIDGSWPWAAARILAIGSAGALAIRVLALAARRWRGVLSASIGLLVVPAGGALTSSYAGTDGARPLVGGVAVLLGGLVILTLGVAWLARSIRGWRRVAALLAVVVVGYAVGLPMAVATYATNVGRPDVGAMTPADRGLAYVDASFDTSDGVTLSGWYLPSSNGAAIVMMAGASSTRSAVLEQAGVLARHGYGVLLFDARGMGRSGGRGMALGWYGDRDVIAAVDHLVRTAGIDPSRIGALGESMGGEEAIGAMAADARIRAVIAEGATGRVDGDWDWLSDRYGLRGSLQRGIHWLTTTITDAFTSADPPITLRAAVVAAAPRPVLLIAAGSQPDEVNADRDIQRSSPGSVELWVVPGASHVGGLRAAPDEWERRVVAFFDATLAPPGA